MERNNKSTEGWRFPMPHMNCMGMSHSEALGFSTNLVFEKGKEIREFWSRIGSCL